MNLKAIRKAIVPVAVAIVITLLSRVGVVESPELVQQVTLVITGVLVYLIPNEG
jgi:hypothetical protein